jgi:hypothetical protein
MAENKTKPTSGSVQGFLEGIENPVKRNDSMALVQLMSEITGADPVMWGDAIVGFGDYRYKYASGREGDWFQVGFSPRKQNLSIYVMGYLEQYPDILKDLGKYKHGKGCLYVKRLEDIDMEVLRSLIETSIQRLGDHSHS